MNAQRDWHSEPETPNETIETGRPDPVLHEEKAGPFRLTIFTIGGLVILGLVLYGLNQPHPQNEINAQQTATNTAAQPQQPATTAGAAPQDEKKAPAKAQGGDQGKAQ